MIDRPSGRVRNAAMQRCYCSGNRPVIVHCQAPAAAQQPHLSTPSPLPQPLKGSSPGPVFVLRMKQTQSASAAHLVSETHENRHEQVRTNDIHVLASVLLIQTAEALPQLDDLLSVDCDVAGLPLQAVRRPRFYEHFYLNAERRCHGLPQVGKSTQHIRRAEAGVLAEAPPDGWCSMTRLLGRDRRLPASPAVRSRDAMDAA